MTHTDRSRPGRLSICALVPLICIIGFHATGSAAGRSERISPEAFRALEREVVQEWRGFHKDTSGEPTSEGRAAFREKVRQLFDQSPSMLSLALYAQGFPPPNSVPSAERDPEGSKAYQRGVAEFHAMAGALTRDFSEEPAFPPAFEGYDFVNHDPRGQRAPAGSLFASASDVMGWARSAFEPAAQLRTSDPPQTRLAVRFDGMSVAALAPVYEMAKHLRRKVVVDLSEQHTEEFNLEQAQPLFDINTSVITTDLPAYAITPRGIVAGRFVSAGFFGGACSSRQPTAAEFAFPAPVPDAVLGVIVTGLKLDPRRARVQVKKNTWPDLENGAQALSTRVTFSVDLNGDGVPELRGAGQNQSEIESVLRRYGTPSDGGWEPVPIAGWSANDFEFLDANVAGRWMRLSSYHVLTCA